MADEWFRSHDWSSAVQADFEVRLARARPYNRAQYLRIKGLAVAESGIVDAARGLWQRVMEDRGEFAFTQQCAALEHLADSFADTEPTRAIDLYRRLLSDFSTRSGTTAMQHVKLAEIEGARAAVQQRARAALALCKQGPVFPHHGDVGVVEADRRALKRLRKLAR